jgi:hypothetical protein
MKISKDKIESLLNSESVIEIENSIAAAKGCAIYKENMILLISFIQEEIDKSELTFEQLSSFINNNKESIIKFANIFLEKESPSSLSCGIAITYSIYMIYLKEKGDKLLQSYIEKRNIPNAKKLLERLKKVQDVMNL